MASNVYFLAIILIFLVRRKFCETNDQQSNNGCTPVIYKWISTLHCSSSPLRQMSRFLVRSSRT